MKPKTLKQYIDKCHKYPWFEMNEIYNKYKSNIERIAMGKEPLFYESFALENAIEKIAIDRFMFLKMVREKLLFPKIKSLPPSDNEKG